jgi:hypothetical protein
VFWFAFRITVSIAGRLNRESVRQRREGPMLTIIGWLFIAFAAYNAARTHSFDRHMQTFRAPNVPTSAFHFVPLRWREELYIADGRRLVQRAWRAFATMAASFVIGAALIAIGS